MPTVIPTAKIVEQASPGIGHWVADPLTGLYRPFPHWLDVDFDRDASGKLVAAICAPNQDGIRSRLEVWQFDDSYPENATTFVTVEPSGVSGASLRFRPDGRLDLFYLLNTSLVHRHSVDQGRTWSDPNAYTLIFASGAAFTPIVYPYSAGTTTIGPISSGFERYVVHGYDRTGRVLVMLYNVIEGGLTNQRAWHFFTGDPDTGGSWALGNGIPFPAPFTLTAISFLGSLQTMRSGIIVPGCEHTIYFRAFKSDGTLTNLGYNTSPGSSLNCWTDEATGMRLWVVGDGTPHGGITGGGFNICAYKMNNDLSWTLFFQDVVTNRFSGAYAYTYTTTGSDRVTAQATCHQIKQRRDGIWEFMFVRSDEQPVIIRCRKIGYSAAGVWE
jgi:hypothetical protein